MMKGSFLKTAIKVILWIFAAWLALAIILEIALSPAILSKVVDKFAKEYVDADVTFGKVRASMFRRFPSVSLTLDDFAVTYPSDRFDEAERYGAQGMMLHQGCGQTADTLAAFERFSVSIRPGALIMGNIKVPHLILTKPRIFAHSYHDGSANWNILKLSEDDREEEEDSSQVGGMPEVSLGRILMDGNPHIVYTDSRDTVFALLNVRRIFLKGGITNGKTGNRRMGVGIDSLMAAGRIGRDTLAFGLERLKVNESRGRLGIEAKARTWMATSSFGRMEIPIEVDGRARIVRDTVPSVSIRQLDANVASIPISVKGELFFENDGLGIKEGEIRIDNCILEDVARNLLSGAVPELSKFSTDAALNVKVDCNGKYIYESGKLPQLRAEIDIPQAEVRHVEIGDSLALSLSLKAATDADGRLDVNLTEAGVGTVGLNAKIQANVHDVLCGDPDINLDGSVEAHLDPIASHLPDSLGIDASGKVQAGIHGKARLSQLNLYNFSSAELLGEVKCDSVEFVSARDSIDLYINSFQVRLGPEDIQSRKDSTLALRLLAICAEIDSTTVRAGGMNAVGKGISIVAKSSADMIKGRDSSKVHHLGGTLSAKRLSLIDGAGSRVAVADTRNGFQLIPKQGNSKVPVLMFNSSNKRIFLKSGYNRIAIRDAHIGASAAMNSIERRQKAKAYIDSLARKYPDIPRDSLFRHIRPKSAAKSKTEIPEWLREEDFKKQDIDIRLDRTLAKYFNEWDLNGDISVGKGSIMTPYFPLRNSLQGFKGHFDNNQVRIDDFRIRSGESSLAAKGRLSGLKRALTGRRGAMLKFDLDVTSDGMDANELLRAYTIGSRFNPDGKEGLSELSDDEYMDAVTADSSKIAEAGSSLIVIPANIDADISLDASGIRYSELNIDKLTADMKMKERCVQITNTVAASNMGDIHFDGFYATRSKKDLKAGFSFNFIDITAEKVISLMPAIDTLMPMLKSFNGLLNCEMAATAQLDTNMNIVLPSINGIMRITGDNLAIKDSDMFRTLAKKLLFRNKKEGRIDHMSVEGIISDNTVEIFPFVLKMDRYMLAMSGVQNLDMSFKYHVSLIKSPFLIRLGVDLSGPDFDNLKFKIGRPKYRSADVPVFSSVIDGRKVNLKKSIEDIFRKGIDAAVKENDIKGIFNFHKQKIGYVRAVDQQLEALSEAEQKQLEADEAAAQAEEAGEAGGATPEEAKEIQNEIL